MRMSEIDSSIALKEDSKKLQWLSLAPSVGYSQLSGFNVSLSASPFLRYIQQKRSNDIEIQRYRFQQLARLDDEILRIEDKILELSSNIQMLQLRISDLSLLYDQYQISLNQSNYNEISYSQYLSAQYQYSYSWTSLYGIYLGLKAKLSAISSKYNTSLTSLSLELNNALDRLNSLKP